MLACPAAAESGIHVTADLPWSKLRLVLSPSAILWRLSDPGDNTPRIMNDWRQTSCRGRQASNPDFCLFRAYEKGGGIREAALGEADKPVLYDIFFCAGIAIGADPHWCSVPQRPALNTPDCRVCISTMEPGRPRGLHSRIAKE